MVVNLFIDTEGQPAKFYIHPEFVPYENARTLKRQIRDHGGKIIDTPDGADTVIIEPNAGITCEALQNEYWLGDNQSRRHTFVEDPEFISDCISTERFEHIVYKTGLGGNRRAARVRVPFTPEDVEHLCTFIARFIPWEEQGGRTGYLLYEKLMEQPGAWTKRHTAQSWREHYKKNADSLDPLIAEIRRKEQPFGISKRDRRLNRRDRGVIVERVDGDDEGEEVVGVSTEADKRRVRVVTDHVRAMGPSRKRRREESERAEESEASTLSASEAEEDGVEEGLNPHYGGNETPILENQGVDDQDVMSGLSQRGSSPIPYPSGTAATLVEASQPSLGKAAQATFTRVPRSSGPGAEQPTPGPSQRNVTATGPLGVPQRSQPVPKRAARKPRQSFQTPTTPTHPPIAVLRDDSPEPRLASPSPTPVLHKPRARKRARIEHPVAPESAPFRNTRSRSRSVEPPPAKSASRKKGKQRAVEPLPVLQLSIVEEEEEELLAPEDSFTHPIPETLLEEQHVELMLSERQEESPQREVLDEDDAQTHAELQSIADHSKPAGVPTGFRFRVTEDPDELLQDHMRGRAAGSGSMQPSLVGEARRSTAAVAAKTTTTRVLRSQQASERPAMAGGPSRREPPPRLSPMGETTLARSPRRKNSTTSQESFPLDGTRAKKVVLNAKNVEKNSPYKAPRGSRASQFGQ